MLLVRSYYKVAEYWQKFEEFCVFSSILPIPDYCHYDFYSSLNHNILDSRVEIYHA